MTVIRPHGAPLDGRPANPRQSRQRDRTQTFWPVGEDGDSIYLNLGTYPSPAPVKSPPGTCRNTDEAVTP